MSKPEPTEEMDAEEATQATLDLERENRMFLKSAIPILAARSHDTDPSPRVQLALDRAMIALCERIGRIGRSDLPSDEG